MSYSHYSMGTVTSLEAITLDDVKHFYASQYAQSNLILGISGGYPPAFLERMKKDFRRLPVRARFPAAAQGAAADRREPRRDSGIKIRARWPFRWDFLSHARAGIRIIPRCWWRRLIWDNTA